MSIEDLTIREARSLAEMLGHPAGDRNQTLAPDDAWVIAVLQRGHVVVGRYHQSGEVATLICASVVRRWGTSKGLGQLAEGGPQPNTVLDPCPEVSFHIREAVMVMRCGNAWGK